jgi:hypothetical protein
MRITRMAGDLNAELQSLEVIEFDRDDAREEG